MSSQENTLRKFKGAVAVVTGGASGIGKSMSKELARRGCEVILADRQEELAQKVAQEIQAEGGLAVVSELDVRDHMSFDALLQQTKERTGRLDYVFNNAGIAVGGDATQMTVEQWHDIIDVNIKGVSNGTHAALKIMKAQGYGHIVNTASMAGLGPVALLAAYSMTKHAVVGLSTSLRAELHGTGINVSVLCPGFIRTPILEGGKYGSLVGSIDKETVKKLTQPKWAAYDADKFAKSVVTQIGRNRALIIVPRRWVGVWLSSRLSMAWALFVSRKMGAQARKKMSGKE